MNPSNPSEQLVEDVASVGFGAIGVFRALRVRWRLQGWPTCY